MPRDGLDGSNELVVKALLIFGETPQGTTISEALDINDVVKINCVSANFPIKKVGGPCLGNDQVKVTYSKPPI